MAISVADNPSANRFELRIDGELAGYASYRRAPGQITFLHTEIDDGHEGQGLGTRLATEVLDAARQRGERVVPRCPFIASFMRDHPEYADLR